MKIISKCIQIVNVMHAEKCKQKSYLKYTDDFDFNRSCYQSDE